MEEINFESYFTEEENKYYNPTYLVNILEDIVGNDLNSIKDMVSNAKVVVTETQIREFLDKKFSKIDPKLKERIEKYDENYIREKTKSEVSILGYSKTLLNYLVDEMDAANFKFYPYTLEYFKKYSDIVRNKSILLLDIIEKISSKNVSSIQGLLKDLDIVLDENGNISKDDIIRLISPTIYNIETLNEKVSAANELSTYLTLKMSKDSLYKHGVSENEMYPTNGIQSTTLFESNDKGTMPLTSKQKRKLIDEENRFIRNNARFLGNIFN